MASPERCRRTMMLGVIVFTLSAGCAQTDPSVTSASGRIHYVVIDDGVSDSNVRAQAGEEVRWVNVRKTPVSVVFNGLQHGDVSCERGFSNSTNSHMTAVIPPDDKASLCFRAGGRQTYRVLDVQRSGVELNHEVSVEVVPAP